MSRSLRAITVVLVAAMVAAGCSSTTAESTTSTEASATTTTTTPPLMTTPPLATTSTTTTSTTSQPTTTTSTTTTTTSTSTTSTTSTTLPTTTTAPPPTTTTVVQSAKHTVKMVDFANNPHSLNIKAGDTVIWVNDGFSMHDATSGVDPTADGAWGSPAIPPGGSWSRKFDAPGTYQYFCALHPGLMPGTIVVDG